MNIKEAKIQIKEAMISYFTKDEFGNYLMPLEQQRPIFLMGAPGIGKTAIMKQIAQEMDVALLSYSMTHHTRQSALGLPYIIHKTYAGEDYEITKYTMSEIIASVYDLMESTGKKEGILFLDEINCVSETLYPVMLQFLQYKVFGCHQLPLGWIIVTAGNPPEYNNSVREFDLATWDRLKRIDVEPDYEVWKEYAVNADVHPAIKSYLDIKRDHFYKVESTVNGKRFVTARGWDDLSKMIKLFEINHLKVNEKLTIQYLQDNVIAKDFAAYYDLFNKYRSDYQIDTILNGNVSDEIKKRASEASFDERLSLLGLILDAITNELNSVIEKENLIGDYMAILKQFREALKGGSEPLKELDKLIKRQNNQLEKTRKAGSLYYKEKRKISSLITMLSDLKQKIAPEVNRTDAFMIAKIDFDTRVRKMKEMAESAGKKLSHVFEFCDSVFQDDQEMLILVTELTISEVASRFIGQFGCKEYFEHNKELLFYERQQEIITELNDLNLGDED